MTDLSFLKPSLPRRSFWRARHVRFACLAVMTIISALVVGLSFLPMAAVFAAALLTSIAGFAFSGVCGALLFHLMDRHVEVVQIMITCSIANQASMTWTLRRDIDWSSLNVFLVGGFVGVLPGVWLLLHANNAVFKKGLGLFLLGYGVIMLFRKPSVWKQTRLRDLGAGFIGGLTGGAVGFHGAFVTIWCGMKGWDKTQQRAVFQPFILILQIMALATIAVTSPRGSPYNLSDLLYVPASLLGTWIGLLCFRRVTDAQFARAVQILLIVSGISYAI